MLDDQAWLLLPAGAYGPGFLALENFQALRQYNASDLYVLFVGNLADRIAGGPLSKGLGQSCNNSPVATSKKYKRF
jgi:Membrane-bound lytic murein transglycosylase B